MATCETNLQIYFRMQLINTSLILMYSLAILSNHVINGFKMNWHLLILHPSVEALAYKSRIAMPLKVY